MKNAVLRTFSHCLNLIVLIALCLLQSCNFKPKAPKKEGHGMGPAFHLYQFDAGMQEGLIGEALEETSVEMGEGVTEEPNEDCPIVPFNLLIQLLGSSDTLILGPIELFDECNFPEIESIQLGGIGIVLIDPTDAVDPDEGSTDSEPVMDS